MDDNVKLKSNKSVRKQRHQKLFGTPHPFLQNFFFFSKKRFIKKRNNSQVHTLETDLHYVNPILFSHFSAKVGAIVFAFFLIASIKPSFAYDQDLNEDINALMAMNQASFIAEKIVTTDDGFILNTSGQTEIGDRSNISDTIIYEVKAGDTLSDIAHKFHIKIETVVWNNDIYDTNRLKTGANLLILPTDGILHTVAKKETLETIAKKYKVKQESIVKQNKLIDSKLLAEQQLIIPGGKLQVPRYIAMNRGLNRQGSNIGKLLKANNYNNNQFENNIISLIKPCAGSYTQYYHRGHYAVDIAHRNKGPIYAAASGKVIKSAKGWNGGYGNVIIIDHGNNVKTLYAHNEKLYVKVGDIVSQGQTVGWMGKTGRVYGRTGIHLHFEIIIKGIKKNPLAYFK